MSMTYTRVAIRPYVEPVFNMGLEKYDQSLFDGAKHTYEIAAIEEGDTVRYITGIDPYAPGIMVLPKDQREAKQNAIKDIVIEAESRLAGNVIRKEDTEWWNKVKRVKPDNISFWSSSDMRIELNNDAYSLEPGKSVTDLLKYMAIKAGGVPEIAINFDKARTSAKAPKFYLDELEETASIKTEGPKLRNKAGSELEKLFDKNINKLMYVLKVVDPNSAQYKKSTPNDIMYANAEAYLNGDGPDSKSRNCSTFIETAALDMETLKLKALVKDCSFYRIIALRSNGMLYEMESSTPLGKNVLEVVEFLKNPLNEDVYKRLLSKAEGYWKL